MERLQLLSLADELLIEILKHVLVLDGTEVPIPKDPKPFLSVLGSCRKLREMGIDILLKENTYQFTGRYPRYNQLEQTGGPIHLDRLATPSFNPRNVVRSVYLIVDKDGSKARWTRERDKNNFFRWLLPLKHLAWHGFWGTELVRMAIRNDAEPPTILESQIDAAVRNIAHAMYGVVLKSDFHESVGHSHLKAVTRSAKDIWIRAKKFEIVEGLHEEIAKAIQDGVHVCMCNGPEDAARQHTEETQVVSRDRFDILDTPFW